MPLKIQYRYRPAEYGDHLVRMYLLTNNKESKLGTTPLPDGTVRLFRQNGHDGLSFLVAQSIKYVPIGDKIELNLGADPEVIFDLVKLRPGETRSGCRSTAANVYQRVDQPGVQIEINSSVAGWDDHTLFCQRVRNYTKKPIDLEIRRSFGGRRGLSQRVAGQEPRLPDRGVHGAGAAGAEGANCFTRSCSDRDTTPGRTT